MDGGGLEEWEGGWEVGWEGGVGEGLDRLLEVSLFCEKECDGVEGIWFWGGGREERERERERKEQRVVLLTDF